MPMLDFEPIEKNKDRYIEAIHAGHAGDYVPMKLVFFRGPGFFVTTGFPEREHRLTYFSEPLPVSIDVEVAALRIIDLPEASLIR
jgi:hypothetical protein